MKLEIKAEFPDIADYYSNNEYLFVTDDSLFIKCYQISIKENK